MKGRGKRRKGQRSRGQGPGEGRGAAARRQEPCRDHWRRLPRAGEGPRPHLPVRGGGGFPPGPEAGAARGAELLGAARPSSALPPLAALGAGKAAATGPSPPGRPSRRHGNAGWGGRASPLPPPAWALPGTQGPQTTRAAGARGVSRRARSLALPCDSKHPGRGALPVTPPVSHLAASGRGGTRVEQRDKRKWGGGGE